MAIYSGFATRKERIQNEERLFVAIYTGGAGFDAGCLCASHYARSDDTTRGDAGCATPNPGPARAYASTRESHVTIL